MYTLVSILALMEAAYRAQGKVCLKETSLAVYTVVLGEVISPFLGQDKSVIVSVRTRVDDQCLYRGQDMVLLSQHGGLPGQPWKKHWQVFKESVPPQRMSPLPASLAGAGAGATDPHTL